MNRRAVLLGFGTLAAVGAKSAAAQEQDTALEPPLLLPRIVPAPADALPEEIHVYPDEFALYWVLSDGLALLYACGIGRDGLYEAGDFTVGAKKEWPSWTPTPEMIERDPDQYSRWADGMPGGPDNPLGARALYLFTPERGDTMLRIHGTNKPETIGTAVSNGCVRVVNEDIIDLYERVPLNARVVLHAKGEGGAASTGTMDIPEDAPDLAVAEPVARGEAPALPSAKPLGADTELSVFETGGLY